MAGRRPGQPMRESRKLHWTRFPPLHHGILCLFLYSVLCPFLDPVTADILCTCTQAWCKVRAELKLSSAVYESGSNISATCTLISASGDHCNSTAAHIFFKYDGKRFNSSSILNNISATVTIPNAKREESGAHLFCYVEDYVNKVSDGRILPQPIGQTVIHIADKLEAPQFTGCVVYNWLSMTCTWEPALPDNGIDTIQNLYWSILPGEDGLKCPLQSHGKCTWPSLEGPPLNVTPFRRDFEYNLEIRLENRLGTVSEVASVSTRNEVKPDKVVRVNSIRTSTSVTVVWSSPVPQSIKHHQYLLIYNISLVYQDTTIKVNQLTSNNMTISYEVDGLTPYTSYNIAISCKPVIDGTPQGYWSDPYLLSVLTLADVPGVAPMVTPGGYRLSYTDDGSRFCEVYWQPVPETAKHGRILQTRVRVFRLVEGNNPDCSSPDPDYSRILNDSDALKEGGILLDSISTYAVCVDVRNERGFNHSIPLQPVVIPSNRAFGNLDFTAEGLGNNIMLSWQPVEHAVQYTVYWCQGSPLYLCAKKHALAWQHFPNTTSVAQLTLPTGTLYHNQVLAMSTQYIDQHGMVISDGLLVAECIFPAEKDPSMPSNVEVPENQYRQNGLGVKWRKPKCGETGYIQSFSIWYCEEKNCQDDKGEEIHVPVQVGLNGDIQEFVIENLSPGSAYMVRIASVGHNLTSSYTEPVHGTVHLSGLSMLQKAWLWIAIISGIIILAALIPVSIRMKKKCQKRFAHLNIVMLDDVERQHVEDDHCDTRIDVYTDPLMDNGFIASKIMEDQAPILSKKNFPNGPASGDASEIRNRLLSNAHVDQCDTTETEILLSGGATGSKQSAQSNTNMDSYNLVAEKTLSQIDKNLTEIDSLNSNCSSGKASSLNSTIEYIPPMMFQESTPCDGDPLRETMSMDRENGISMESLDVPQIVNFVSSSGSNEESTDPNDIIRWATNLGEMKVKQMAEVEDIVLSSGSDSVSPLSSDPSTHEPGPSQLSQTMLDKAPSFQNEDLVNVGNSSGRISLISGNESGSQRNSVDTSTDSGSFVDVDFVDDNCEDDSGISTAHKSCLSPERSSSGLFSPYIDIDTMTRLVK